MRRLTTTVRGAAAPGVLPPPPWWPTMVVTTLAAISSLALWCTLFLSGPAQFIGFTALIGALVLHHCQEISHPVTWFGPVFWLYSAAYPILALAGLYEYDEFLRHAVALHAIAFVAFALPLFGCRMPLRTDHWNDQACTLRQIVALLGAALVVPVVWIAIMQLSTLGVITKRDLLDSGSPILSLLSSLMLLLSFLLVLLLVVRLHLQRSLMPVIAVAALVFVPILLYAGERDYMLRFGVIAVLASWDFRRRPAPYKLAIAGLLVLPLLPLLQSFKSVALGNAVSYRFDAMALVAQEFRVMTQNTRLVLESDMARMLGSPFASLAMDLKRAMLPQILGFKATSTQSWFNDVVLFDIQSGRGFSLVASGYLSGGTVGVFVLYASLGLAMRALYMTRGRTYLHLTGYLLAAPLLMYVQRGDLSALIGPALRAILLPALCFMVVVECLRRIATPLQLQPGQGIRGS
jgi:hypothetical protein